VRRWETVLDAMADVGRFWRAREGERYAAAFAADVAGRYPDGNARLHGLSAQLESDLMLTAEPVFVDDGVMTVLEHARKSFEPEALLASDVFCERGFALLPRPLLRTDVNGHLCSTRAFSWQPFYVKERVPWVERDPGEENVEVEFAPLGNAPDAAPAGLVVTLYSHQDDPSDTEVPRDAVAARGWPALTMEHATLWWFGRTPEVGLRGYTDEQARAARGVWRDVQVFFRLAQQRIAERGRERAGRKAAKRLERALDRTDPYVTVVTLRRTKRQGGEGDAEVEWTHRWVVGGHWRNQWYPTLDAHRQIWIADFVKGPEDTVDDEDGGSR
jgi:hypothetical protein